MFRTLLLVLVLVATLTGTQTALHAATSPSPGAKSAAIDSVVNPVIDPAVDTLFLLIQQRLSVMADVANYKWQHSLPIEDLSREGLVLDNAAAGAEQFALQAHSSRAFFSVQIEAAKEIQRAWFLQWQQQGAPLPGPDLNTEIRPRLINLGRQILRQLQLSATSLAAANPQALSQRFAARVEVKHLSDNTRLKLLASLKSIAVQRSVPVTANRLQQILQRAELRVGTTGDYAPFSERDADSGDYRGIDIDMAQDLANSLGAKLTLVPTTWPTLSADFSADKFDLAMSGVSINLKRQRLGFFSDPYHRGGKTPIALCSKINQFDSLEKIDNAGTRVVVNPGGTNFNFVRDHIDRAQVSVFDNNQTIFTEIVEGRADVMITDAIEVQLQSNRQGLLCATMPGKTLTHSEKGYWLQADPYFKEYVDAWLHRRVLESRLSELFARHLQ